MRIADQALRFAPTTCPSCKRINEGFVDRNNHEWVVCYGDTGKIKKRLYKQISRYTPYGTHFAQVILI